MFHVKRFINIKIVTQDNVSRETNCPRYCKIDVKLSNIYSVKHKNILSWSI